MEEEQKETIVEVREEIMVSLSTTTSAKPTKRRAHFLKPYYTSKKPRVSQHPSLYSPSVKSSFELEKLPLRVHFNERSANPTWVSWVNHLKPLYESVWKKAGIFEAIMSSTVSVTKDRNLILGLCETWCPKTNTFVFHWGEATMTLEDVMILGGYSVLGSSVVSCSVLNRDMKEIEAKLRKARTEISRGPSKKSCAFSWKKKFMFSGTEYEHEAFLSCWLGRYVFGAYNRLIKGRVFPIAIHLARGTRVALAPAVLASIYSDLSSLKASLINATKICGSFDGGLLSITLFSPLTLLQLWVFERIPVFQPKPNKIEYGDTRSAVWGNVEHVRVKNVKHALDSSGETFRWRPYTTLLQGWQFPKFYQEREQWSDFKSDFDLKSFALCLRVSQLVGLDCIEQYLPHRVAMQFGFDQDIPCDIVFPSGEIPESAWKFYMRPFKFSKLYFPSRLLDPDVTIQYSLWWIKSMLDSLDLLRDAMCSMVRRRRSFCKRPKQKPLHLIRDFNEQVKKTAEISSASGNEKIHVASQTSDSLTVDSARINSEANMEVDSLSKPGDDTMEFGSGMLGSGDGEASLVVHRKVLGQEVLGLEVPLKLVDIMIESNPAISGSNNVQAGLMVQQTVSEYEVQGLAPKLEPIDNMKYVTGATYKLGGSEACITTQYKVSGIEVPGLALEARIARLEKKVAALKEARAC